MITSPSWLASKSASLNAERLERPSLSSFQNPAEAADLLSSDRKESLSLSPAAQKALSGEASSEGGSLDPWGVTTTIYDSLYSATGGIREWIKYHDNPESGPFSFGQGKEGNCASIATIKAGIDVFGDEVFKRQEGDREKGFDLTLRDGSQVALSRDEYETALKNSYFQGKNGDTEDYANLCYAAMAKRKMDIENTGKSDGKKITYQQACDLLNDGIDTFDAPRYLGLQNNVKKLDDPLDADEYRHYDAVVARTKGVHALYVDGPETYSKDADVTQDNYGDPKAFDGTDNWGDRLTDAFAMAGDKVA
ncbi:MAG: hypothetical protein RDV48_16145 [Candidatus Eremiobacteraeota bacterium]|nr:hypothetical protein [Candidatus Eremiobacteraeota bacterium]